MGYSPWGHKESERLKRLTMHAWVQEFSKNLVRGSNVPLLVAVLIITRDSLGAHFTWFREGNTCIWEVLFRKIYNSDSEEGALWTSQTPLGSVSDTRESQQVLAMISSTNIAIMNSHENNTLRAYYLNNIQGRSGFCRSS